MLLLNDGAYMRFLRDAVTTARRSRQSSDVSLVTRRVRNRRLARAVAIGVACATAPLAAPRAFAQSRPTVSASPEQRKTWVSLSLGPATANGQGRLGGMIALWTTKGPLAFSLRDVAASRFLETGDVGDLSFLAGIHPVRESHADVVLLAGIGESYGHEIGGANMEHEPVVAASAQLNLNYVLVGVGIDGFAAVGSGRNYFGAGLALAVGWFR